MQIFELLKKRGVKLIFGLLLMVLTLWLMPVQAAAFSIDWNKVTKYIGQAQDAVDIAESVGIDTGGLGEVLNNFSNLPGLYTSMQALDASSISQLASAMGIGDVEAFTSALNAINSMSPENRAALLNSAVQPLNDSLLAKARDIVKSGSAETSPTQLLSDAINEAGGAKGLTDEKLIGLGKELELNFSHATSKQIEEYIQLEQELEKHAQSPVGAQYRNPLQYFASLLITPAKAQPLAAPLPGSSADTALATTGTIAAANGTGGGAGGGAAGYVINPELTAAAQGAKRASDFLGWSYTLAKPDNAKGVTAAGSNIRKTLQDLWGSAFKLVLIIYVAIIVVLAFGYIVKANWLDRWKRYIPWLAISLFGAAFSFVIALFVINLFDKAIAGLTFNSDLIIKISYDYNAFQNKLLTSNPAVSSIENVNNTITLLKTLTYTAYTIGGVLVLRTIILWLMVIILPLIFPFIAFPVTQALGKIWLREFIRWLFYGLLVALFFYASNRIYETITNQNITTNVSNYGSTADLNISKPLKGQNGPGANQGTATLDTNAYSQFLASIIMLWISIILPWFLLRFAVGFVSTSTKKWYSRYKVSPYFQQIVKAISPPKAPLTPQGAGGGQPAKPAPLGSPLRQFNQAEKEKIIAPAAPLAEPTLSPIRQEMNIPAGIIKPPPLKTESIRAFQRMPAERALSAAGYAELSDVSDKIERSAKNSEPLTELARLEQDPSQLARLSTDINNLRNPETIANETKRQQTINLKNSVLASGIAPETKGMASLIHNDVAPLAGQSIAHELNEKNIETVKEKTQQLLDSKKITNQSTIRQLQDLSAAVGNYQSTPSVKHGERHMLADSIERAMRNISGGGRTAQPQPGEHIRGAIPAAAAKVLPESELAQSEEGGELLESMDVLSASEVAGTAGTSGVDSLLAEDKDIGKAVADQKTNDDFEKTKKQWVDYYNNTPIPTTDHIIGRSDWIKEQIKEQKEALLQITTGDFEKRKQALQRLEKILPFLMLGHYSLLDVTIYLKAKIAAANSVLDSLKQDNAGQTNAPNEYVTIPSPPARQTDDLSQ